MYEIKNTLPIGISLIALIFSTALLAYIARQGESEGVAYTVAWMVFTCIWVMVIFSMSWIAIRLTGRTINYQAASAGLASLIDIAVVSLVWLAMALMSGGSVSALPDKMSYFFCITGLLIVIWRIIPI